jgi:hypothetical protein
LKATTIIVALAFAVSAFATEYPAHPRERFFWEAEPRGAAAVAAKALALPDDSLVVMLSPAVSFFAPFMHGKDLRFLGPPNAEWAGSVNDPASYAARMQHQLRLHRGPTFVLAEDPVPHHNEAAQALGINVDPTSCRPAPNNLTRVVQLCRGR